MDFATYHWSCFCNCMLLCLGVVLEPQKNAQEKWDGITFDTVLLDHYWLPDSVVWLNKGYMVSGQQRGDVLGRRMDPRRTGWHGRCGFLSPLSRLDCSSVCGETRELKGRRPFFCLWLVGLPLIVWRFSFAVFFFFLFRPTTGA